MNIFILDMNHRLNAQYHCNKHLIKMITEHNQLLSSALLMSGSKAPYKLTHENHPCSVWVRESLSNYLWLIELNKELCLEYYYRYNKFHAGDRILWELQYNIPNIKDIGLTKFAQAMPDDCKNDDSVMAYRNYYIKYKQHLAEWKDRKIPYWFTLQNT